MANDYIPRGNADFNAWQVNFVTYANAFGLIAADTAPLVAPKAAWTGGFTAQIAAQVAAQPNDSQPRSYTLTIRK